MTELKALLAGKLDLLTLVYPCHSPSKERWFSLIGVPLSLGKPAGVALLHANLTSMATPQSWASSTEAERDQKQPTTAAHAMSGAIERSVSKTLSSQLDTMFGGHRQVPTRKIALHREDHPILARARLSKRQLEVLRLLGEGKTNKEIGEALFRSPNTVKLHVSAILKQLKLKSRTQAALLASTLYAEGSTDLPGGDLQSWKKTKIAATQPRARA